MSGNPPGWVLACPTCGREASLRVVDSRLTPKVNAIRRRRLCIYCKARITTYETISDDNQIRRRRAAIDHLKLALSALQATIALESGTPVDAASDHSQVSTVDGRAK